jgi:CTP:molybdopterin cytidylyltransferase MocA
MGAFKPLLPFGDQTVIEACVKNLLDGGIDQMIVVVGHRADEIRSALSNLPVIFALNDKPESEMSVSISKGFEHVPTEADAVFIALVDQPAIPPNVIKILIDEWNRSETLLIPEHNGRGGHPVLIGASFRGELLTLDPARGLRAFFDRHKDEVVRVPIDSPYIARDMDTWEDYVALHGEIFGEDPPTLEGARPNARQRKSPTEV